MGTSRALKRLTGLAAALAISVTFPTASRAESAPVPDDSAAVSAPTASSAVSTGRIAGRDRYETAVKISRRAFPQSFGKTRGTVYLARADVFADALAAGTLTDGPVLLVPSCGGVPSAVASEVRRLNPKSVTALGGTSSVCARTLKTLASGRTVERIAGRDRYGTALAIANRRVQQGGASQVFLASGLNSSPDAVSGGVLRTGPILTLNPDGGTSVTGAKKWVAGHSGTSKKVVAIGGSGGVKPRQLATITAGRPTGRLAGPDRYATSAAVSGYQFPGRASTVYLARGDVFADAVAAGALRDGPLYLTGSCQLPSSVRAAIAAKKPTRIFALGGVGAVCNRVLAEAKSAALGFRTDTPQVVTAGSGMSCKRTATGLLYCWGGNDYGRLGINSKSYKAYPRPQRVVDLTGVTSVSAGSWAHTCATKGTGAAYCWGLNQDGQLGNGTRAVSIRPSQVRGLPKVAAIEAGYRFSCALSTVGDVYCWGANSFGQLGNGTTKASTRPVKVKGIAKIKAITLGTSHACALSGAGATYCWGSNLHGQLGDGTRYGQRTLPKRVAAGLGPVARISAGFVSTCVASTRGYAYCWGDNTHGQLGNGSHKAALSPVRVAGISGVTDVGTGSSNGSFACATTKAHTYCWGDNAEGQLGNGTTKASATPVRVATTASFTRIEVGDTHACALSANRTAYCWGDNDQGELGLGSTGGQKLSPHPVPVAK